MDTTAHILTGALVGAAIGELLGNPAPDNSLMVLGAIAGVAPDLDFLAELKGKEAAWRLHRVALHGWLPVGLLGSGIWLLAAFGPWAIPMGLAAAVIVAGLAMHLLLDWLNSFGVCLSYPFNRHRFAARTHFIFDPFVWLIAGFGLWTNQPLAALVALLLWLAIGPLVRWLLEKRLQQHLPQLLREPVDVPLKSSLEPGFLAPLRWFAVVELPDRYVFAPVFLWRFGQWRQYHKTDAAELQALANTNGVLRAFLSTCDFPSFRLVKGARGSQLVIEDLKWWTELPFRPLAFIAQLGSNDKLENVRQGGFFARQHRANPLHPVPERCFVTDANNAS